MKLDLIVAHREPILCLPLPGELEQKAASLGIELAVRTMPEPMLEKGEVWFNQPIPPNALLYVHGNFGTKYINVERTNRLLQKRQDLRAIIQINELEFSLTYFASPEDYAVARSALEQEFHPRNQMVISTAEHNSFWNGKHDEGTSLHNSFENYVRALKELQGE